MNRTNILLTTLMAAGLFAANGEAANAVPVAQTTQGPHRVYIGPDIFHNHYSRSHHHDGNSISATSNTTFYGFRAGYEYVNPKDIYWDLEGGYAWGNNHLRYSKDHGHYHAHSPNRFGNIEGRVGYTFEPQGKFLLTPFAGVGGYHISSHRHLQSQSNWSYFALGLRSVYTFSPAFDLGLNLKGMRTMHIRNHLGNQKYDGHNTYGYEIDLPLTWHIAGENRMAGQWDIQLEPYFAKLDTRTDGKIGGARLLFGYNF